MAYPAVEIRASCGGHGVFACADIAADTCILEFSGPTVGRGEIERAANDGGHDGFLQVGPEHYLGLSGGADDFVNHACRPNTWVAFDHGRVFLYALTDIAAGAELFFDYGLTQIDFPFRFTCLCGHAECRGEIGNCDEIPPAILAGYRRRGMVPAHVEAALAGAARQSQVMVSR